MGLEPTSAWTTISGLLVGEAGLRDRQDGLRVPLDSILCWDRTACRSPRRGWDVTISGAAALGVIWARRLIR